jgi:hypothetical protein
LTFSLALPFISFAAITLHLLSLIVVSRFIVSSFATITITTTITTKITTTIPGSLDTDKGCGFRGPGESKLETNKRLIKDKIVLLTKDINQLGVQRSQHRVSRQRLGIPTVALVGYTNAGKSTVMNRLCSAGVLAENMLFATLDPTTRRVRLPRKMKDLMAVGLNGEGFDGVSGSGGGRGDAAVGGTEAGFKGQEVLLTDTVGFISKLPTDLIAAFRCLSSHPFFLVFLLLLFLVLLVS